MKKNNINKYLNDINLKLVIYKKIPNEHVLEQYNFQAIDSNNETVNGSILVSFTQINITYVTQTGTSHLYSCLIKHSSINDCVIHNTHIIFNNDKEEVVDTMTRENIPPEEFFNFHNLNNSTNKRKALAIC